MSNETMADLHRNVLVGMTDTLGKAWHYDATSLSSVANHYSGPVPVQRVMQDLFAWSAVGLTPMGELPTDDAMAATGIDADGRMIRRTTADDHMMVVRSDTGAVLGIHSAKYGIQQYSEWLLGAVSNILGDTLSIRSAGLLRGGRVAWVQVTTPESRRKDDATGVEFFPFILATTSHDGTLPTRYSAAVTNVVCDNTHAAALGEHNGRIARIKHRRGATLDVSAARGALQLIDDTADAFAAEVQALTRITVTPAQWVKFRDLYVPLPDAPGRGRTMAENKRDRLTSLYAADPRVAPWNGTGWGVIQAVSTWEHWGSIVRTDNRAEKNYGRMLSGDWGNVDTEAAELLSRVVYA